MIFSQTKTFSLVETFKKAVKELNTNHLVVYVLSNVHKNIKKQNSVPTFSSNTLLNRG